MLETHSDYCPYCGEPIDLLIDLSVESQTYIEDCFVCCRPMVVHVEVIDEEPKVNLASEND